MQRRALLLVVFFVLAAAAAGWFSRSLGSRDLLEPGVAGDQDALQGAALAEQYRLLERRVARLELVGGTQSSVQSSSSRSAPAESLGELLEKQQTHDIEQRTRYQDLFESDLRAADALKWEAHIARNFTNSNVVSATEQPSTRTAECRARLCRIVATFPPDSDGSDWATRMSMALADGFSNSRSSWYALPSGESALTIYAFKKGSEKSLLQQGF